MPGSEIWQSLEYSRQVRERTKENACRLATSYAQYSMTGWGEKVVPHCFNFDATYIEEPRFTYGYVVDTDNGPDLVDGHFPMGWAFVYDWRINGDGFYTGAWCGFIVSTFMFQSHGSLDGSADPGYHTKFHLNFQALAIKDLPAHLLDY